MRISTINYFVKYQFMRGRKLDFHLHKRQDSAYTCVTRGTGSQCERRLYLVSRFSK